MQLVLASASPRRRELLASLGIDFQLGGAAELDETALLSAAEGATLPLRLEQLALAKGHSIALARPAALVLSADTEVILDGSCLGKPPDAAAARSMLAELSGRSHSVCSAVALQCSASGLRLSAHALTKVEFAPLSASQISTYVARCKPFDFAGGYAIQGLGALLVSCIHGDYSNVVGLPLRLTAGLLEQAGYQLL